MGSSSGRAYTRTWDDQHGQHFDFSHEGHQGPSLYAPKYNSKRPKASGQSISAPGSSIVTTPSSSSSGVVDHVLVKHFIPPKIHTEFLTNLTKHNTKANRGPGSTSKLLAYPSLEAASAPMLRRKAGSRIAAGSSSWVATRAKQLMMKPRGATILTEKKLKIGRETRNNLSPVLNPYALRDRTKLSTFNGSPTSMLSVSLSSPTLKKRKLNSEGSAAKPIALDSDSESEAVTQFNCARNGADTGDNALTGDVRSDGRVDDSVEPVVDPEDIASQAVARIINCDAAIGLFHVTVDLFFHRDRMYMRNIRGKYEQWSFEHYYGLEIKHLHDVRSYTVSMETETSAQVEVDETDCTSHLLKEASYIALKMPLIDQAAVKGFYNPMGSDVSKGYVVFCPMENASGDSLGDVIEILRGHTDIQTIDDKEQAKEYLQALTQHRSSYKSDQLCRRRNSTGEPDGTPESDEECVGGSIALLTYPLPPCTTDVVTIVRRDVSRLNPKRYLNDNVIDYYFKRMMLETFRDHKLVQEKVLFLSSHFYSRLQAGKGSTAGARMEAGYKNVSSWISRSSLFTRSIIFIPINKDMHWSLAVILNPGIAGAESSNEEAFSCIAVLDPLGSYHRKAAIIRNLRAFLRMQWANSEERLCEIEAEAVSEYGVDRVLTLSVDTPLQENSYDCGVYVLKFAEVMLKNCLDLDLLAQNEGVISKDVTDNHLEALITSSAFTAEDITATRKQIQQYIEVDTREYLLLKDKASTE